MSFLVTFSLSFGRYLLVSAALHLHLIKRAFRIQHFRIYTFSVGVQSSCFSLSLHKDQLCWRPDFPWYQGISWNSRIRYKPASQREDKSVGSPMLSLLWSLSFSVNMSGFLLCFLFVLFLAECLFVVLQVFICI